MCEQISIADIDSNYSTAETDKNSAGTVKSLVNAWAELEKTKEAENELR